MVECTYHSFKFKAGVFSSTLNKCKLLDEKLEQLEAGNTDKLIYFERNFSNIGIYKYVIYLMM